MNLVILDEAKIEINEQVAWYRDRDSAAAERLAILFEEAVIAITGKPFSFSLMEMRRNPGNVRRVRLRNFPIYIPYQVLQSDIYVIAVAHTARHPGYWRSRLRKK
jgi:plasmid stabilization system protein ParE